MHKPALLDVFCRALMSDQMKLLSSKTAVITGGGRGIGAAIAMKLASWGANTVVCGRTEAPLKKTAESIRAAGGHSEAIACDVTDLAALEALARRVDQTFGGCDVLVNKDRKST